MQAIELLGATFVLVTTLGIGLVAHELTHAVVLHSLGVPYDINWFPGRNRTDRFDLGLMGAWATVTPRAIPRSVSTMGLRVSALAPLTLTLPFALVVAGVVSDPLNSNNVVVVAGTVAWLACALPSPQDFSLFWHADQAVDEVATRPRENV